MTVLDEILEWSDSLSEEWLQDAVRRLVVQQSLSPGDLDEVFEMFQFEAGLRKEPPATMPVPLKAKHLPNRTVAGSVALTRIGPVSGVNALADSETIELEPNGLNIVYGRNASGKSGYSRVLKKACRARDSEERLWGNVFLQSQNVEQRAEFEVLVGGRPETVIWSPENAPDETASVAVFDSRCARLYLDKSGDIACMPYGLDVFQGLCDALDEFSSRLDRYKTEIDVPGLPEIALGTEARGFADGLSAQTTDAQIDFACEFGDETAKHLEELRRLLAESPENEAKRLRRLAERLKTLSPAIVGARDTLAGEPSRLATLQRDVDAAREAVDAASALTFDDCLPGVGTDPWRTLFAAAQAYSVGEAYKEQEFPVVDGEARCVLCHQPLDDHAKKRFVRFKQFVDDEAGLRLDQTKAALSDATLELAGRVRTLAAIDDALLEEAGEFRESLAVVLGKVRAECKARIAGSDTDVAIGRLASVCPDLVELAGGLEADAEKALETLNVDEKRRLEDEASELEARQVLASSKATVVKRRDKLVDLASVEEAQKQLRTRRVTDAFKRIATSAVSDDLMEAWQQAAETLGIALDCVVMKNTPGKGCFKSKMELNGCQTGASLVEVLSEGEQRVIALAAFIAELSLADTANAIVFDDPVSSLDHNYRAKVAKSIANLAASRQVIVFTHDLVFVHDLARCCDDAEITYAVRGIHRGGTGEVGKCSADGCPAELLPLKDHLDQLNTDYGKLKEEHAANGESAQYLRRVNDWYESLRKAWEKAVEEMLLNKVVQSFRDDVMTQSLREVEVTDDDWRDVLEGMSAGSGHAHRMSAARDTPPPAPDALRRDLDSLIEFKKRVKGRREELRQRRPKASAPR